MKFRRNIIRQNLRRRFSVGWKNLFLDWRRFGCIECPHLKRAAANSFRIDGSFELLWFPKVLCRKYRSWNVPIKLENSLKVEKPSNYGFFRKLSLVWNEIQLVQHERHLLPKMQAQDRILHRHQILRNHQNQQRQIEHSIYQEVDRLHFGV